MQDRQQPMTKRSATSGRTAASRQQDTRQRLLQAAEQAFGTHGFHYTQVADITARADLGIGTFYRYFQDKEDVLRVVLDSFYSRVREELREIRQGIELRTPVEQIEIIRATYRTVLREFLGRPLIAMIMFRGGYGVSAQINELIWNFLQTMTQDVVSDLRRAMAAGLLESARPDLVAECVAGIVLQVAHKLVVTSEDRIDEAVETCTRFTLGGLAGFATESYFEAMGPAYRDLLRVVPIEDNSHAGIIGYAYGY